MDKTNLDVLNEIQKETSFWGLLKLVSKIPYNIENLLVPLFFLVLFFFFNCYESGVDKIDSEKVTSFAKDLVGWYYTILGFLIAGYTVFASVTSIDLSVKLAKYRNDETGLPWLKFIHATFFKTIIIYFVASCFSLFTVLIFRSWGFLMYLVSSVGDYKIVFLSAVDAINVSLFVLSLMMLKSFLFNIYSSVMIAVGMKLLEEPDMPVKKRNRRRFSKNRNFEN